jgi:excisionase family DNA binding protein
VEILTPKDVAALLTVSERTIKRLAVAGDLPGIKIGGKWRFDKAAVEARVTEGKRVGQ